MRGPGHAPLSLETEMTLESTWIAKLDGTCSGVLGGVEVNTGLPSIGFAYAIAERLVSKYLQAHFAGMVA